MPLVTNRVFGVNIFIRIAKKLPKEWFSNNKKIFNNKYVYMYNTFTYIPIIKSTYFIIFTK